MSAGEVVALLTGDRTRLLSELKAGRVDVARFKRDIQGSPVKIDASLASLDRALKQARDRYEATARAIERRDIKVGVDVSEVQRAAAKADAALKQSAEQTRARFRQLLTDAVSTGAGVSAALGRVGLAQLGGTAATGGAVALLGMVRNLAGGLLLLPAAGAAAAAGIGTAVVAFQGMKDAMDAETPADWAKALRNLSPEARAVAVAVKALSGETRALRLDVQDEFFRGMADEVRDLGHDYLPVMRRGLVDVAAAMNRGARSFADFLRQKQSLADTALILDNTATAFDRAAPAGTAFASILRDVTATGSELLPGLSEGLGTAASRWAGMVSQARESGALSQWMRDGITTAEQLGSVVGNLAGTVGAVMDAGKASGASLLSTLEEITGQLEAGAKSAEGQRIIGSLLSDAHDAAMLLLPVLAAAARVAADDLAPALLEIGKTAAPAVEHAVTGFGDAVSEASPGLNAFVGGMAAMVDTAADALPVAGRLANVVGTVLGGALDVAWTALGGVVRLLDGLPTPLLAAAAAMLVMRLNQDRATAGAGSLRDAWSRMGEQARVQQSLAAAQGESLSRIGAQMAVLESRVPAVGRMADAYRTWSTRVQETVAAHGAMMVGMGGVDGKMSATATAVDRATTAVGRLGGVATGAAAAGISGLKSAAGGLMGALGGPWGLAIGAATAVLGILISKQQEAAAAAAAHKARVSALADTLDRQTGAVTKATREMQAKQLAEKGLFSTGLQLGISQTQLLDAFTGQAPAINAVNARLREHARTVVSGSEYYRDFIDITGESKDSLDLLTESALGNSSATKELADRTDSHTASIEAFAKGALSADPALRTLAQSLGMTTDELQTAKIGTKDAAAAMGGATKEASAMEVAVTALGSGVDGAAEDVRGLASALEALAGDMLTQEEAAQKVNDLTRDLGKAFKEAAAEAKAAKRDMVDASGAIDTTTAAGSRLQDAVANLAVAYRNQYAATLQATGSHDQAAAAANKARAELIKEADAAGLSADAAVQLANNYGLIPEFVRTQILQPGMSAGQRGMELLRDKILDVPDNKSVIVSSNAAPVIGLVESLGYKVEHLKDGRFRVIADTDDADTAVNNFIARNSRRTITIGVTTAQSAAGVWRPGPQMAEGGILRYFADGGVHGAGMSPMSMTPSIVSSYKRTGVKRVIGDNPTFDEAYNVMDPHNPKSQAILDYQINKLRPEWAKGRTAAPSVRTTNVDRRRTVTYNINGPDARAVAREVRDLMRAEESLYGA
ncbi:hypothetical protein [Actinokineospora globicatena]|uniref:hypothetical protein n=1 Tax=Actinokineospora globicatena TaxID=103729 RepID=UPI0025527FB2|nr:hypothetical protein [Actinokineospora globicatena]